MSHITWLPIAVLTTAAALAVLACAVPSGATTVAPAAAIARLMTPANLPAGLPHTHLPEGLLTNTANGSATTGNWSGYVDVACSTCRLRYAETQFTIPSVSCPRSTIGSSGYAFVAHWVGLDGFGNGTVEQTGVDGYCYSTSSAPVYYAWYEMYPLDPVVYNGVSPGDAINASVYYNGSGYQLELTDVTTGGSINTTQACPSGQTCDRTAAEVITEDPGGAVAGGYDLADFGQSNFLNSQVTSLGGVHGNYTSNGYWSPYTVKMASRDAMASPGPTEGGAAFPVTWLASQ